MFKVGERGIVFVGTARAFRRALEELNYTRAVTLEEFCRWHTKK